MKITYKNSEVQIKDGRKIVARIPTTLRPAALDGLIAGADATLPLEQLVATLTAAAEEAALRKGSVIPNEYRYQYGADQNCGDEMASALTDACTVDGKVSVPKVEQIASDNGVADRFDAWLARDLNPGMLRMNLGNVLRGKLRRGEAVVVPGFCPPEAQPTG